MKIIKNIFTIILIIGIWACGSKPKPNLELFSPEAFAFDIGDGWEINANVNAKGFLQKEIDDGFHSKISYSVDLITPESDSLFSIYEDEVEEIRKEELIDIPLESQIEIDYNFSEGIYKLIFNVKDEFSDQQKSITINFQLSR